MITKIKNEQEIFWEGNFGDDYISRNSSNKLINSNINLFKKIFKNKSLPKNTLEIGANIGLNLKALKKLKPNIDLYAVEINKKAVKSLQKVVDKKNIFEGSIFDFNTNYFKKKFELVFTKTVLIHIDPKVINKIYKTIYNLSSKYILICEYYNPIPVKIKYRDFENKLFKRDFAGDLMSEYKNLKLIDYGFVYHNDPKFPQDDLTWFLMKKL